ncbi:TetR/AcrR family transcriptional regulator [Pseudonocardia sp. C8]|uniref:TetR/AcrR family transcriptional regulator n=1 Tax=Pseudonocardia sp. C8 TaxID=2762759 RepID=UPI001642D872|nr:TetR/AcrR family transcriptional regulator [Pseudonocardia sp. C8]MBC3189808.1 TetR/AcrR family transcriptional regulator [Pseudonocardia sp. C8]
MAKARTPREAWIDAGLRTLAAGGPDAVRIEALARDLGVTKGGFYGFFADRPALLDALLDAWERRAVAEVLERVEQEGGDPLTRARRAGALTFSGELTPVDLAIRDWARRDPDVADRLRRVDGRRMDYLRAQFAGRFTDDLELEARCLLAFSAAIATGLIAADHPGHTRREVLGRATALLFSDGRGGEA